MSLYRENVPKIQLPRLRRGTKPYTDMVKSVRALVHTRLAHYSAVYAAPHGAVSIRKQKTRWGSCARNGNLSFNVRIGFLPARLADYVIVHELCHTKQHNHSAAFWALVAREFPDYKELRRQLRYGYRF